MHTFFHGWRRKAGCVTLVMALVLMGMWIRSLSSLDTWSISSPSPQKLASLRGTILWWPIDKPGSADPDFLQWERTLDVPQLWGGFGILEYPGVGGVRIIPYWCVVLPLVLCSVSLMLSNPSWRPITRRMGERIGWGMVGMVTGVGLSFCLPVLLVTIGIRPAWFGNFRAIDFLPAFAVAVACSGVAGLLAGVIRPGRQSIRLTILINIVTDVCFIAWYLGSNDGKSALFYFVATAIKFVLLILINTLGPQPIGRSKSN